MVAPHVSEGTLFFRPLTRGATRLGVGSLDRLELKLHHLAPDHITQIVLPEPPVAWKVIDQKFKTQPSPQRQQANVDRHLAKAGGRVVAETAMIGPEITE